MPFASLPTGAHLHYCVSGKGETVLAIHGLLGNPESHLHNVIDLLSEKYCVVAPTLRGYGRSLPKPRTFPVDFYKRDALDVLALMDALAVEKAHILGYSDGGEIALLLGALAPDRFHSIITWGAVGSFTNDLRPLVQRVYPGTWITDEEKRIHSLADPEELTHQWVRALSSIIDSGGDVSLSRAEDVKAPLLMMLGKDDLLNPEANGRRFVQRTAQGRLVMFDTGHAVHDEDWDLFQKTVLNFLDSVGT